MLTTYAEALEAIRVGCMTENGLDMQLYDNCIQSLDLEILYWTKMGRDPQAALEAGIQSCGLNDSYEAPGG